MGNAIVQLVKSFQYVSLTTQRIPGRARLLMLGAALGFLPAVGRMPRCSITRTSGTAMTAGHTLTTLISVRRTTPPRLVLVTKRKSVTMIPGRQSVDLRPPPITSATPLPKLCNRKLAACLLDILPVRTSLPPFRRELFRYNWRAPETVRSGQSPVVTLKTAIF